MQLAARGRFDPRPVDMSHTAPLGQVVPITHTPSCVCGCEEDKKKTPPCLT